MSRPPRYRGVGWIQEIVLQGISCRVAELDIQGWGIAIVAVYTNEVAEVYISVWIVILSSPFLITGPLIFKNVGKHPVEQLFAYVFFYLIFMLTNQIIRFCFVVRNNFVL